MKFKTQHKKFKVFVPGKSDPLLYMAHRDGKSIWITGGIKCTTLMSRTCETVSEAKRFMNSPGV